MPSAYHPGINARAYSSEQLTNRLIVLLRHRAANPNTASAHRWAETARIVAELKERRTSLTLCKQARRLGPETRQARRPTVRYIPAPPAP